MPRPKKVARKAIVKGPRPVREPMKDLEDRDLRLTCFRCVPLVYDGKSFTFSDVLNNARLLYDFVKGDFPGVVLGTPWAKIEPKVDAVTEIEEGAVTMSAFPSLEPKPKPASKFDSANLTM